LILPIVSSILIFKIIIPVNTVSVRGPGSLQAKHGLSIRVAVEQQSESFEPVDKAFTVVEAVD
jgi:hypothetical protein